MPSNFTLTVAASTKMTCAQAVTALLRHKRRWEVRSARAAIPKASGGTPGCGSPPPPRAIACWSAAT